MGSHKNNISKVASQLIQKLDKNWKNLTLKSHEHGSESYNKFKNSLSKITQLSLWAFFYNVYHSYKTPFFGVSYLFTLGGVLVMCHFCEVLLFLNHIKGYFLCWVSFLLGVYDSAVFVLLQLAMCIRNIPCGCKTVVICCFTSSSNQ